MLEPTLNLFESFAKELSNEILVLAPRILLAIIIIAITYLVMRVVGWAVKKILTLLNIEDLVKRYLNVEIPFSLTTLILAIFYIAVGLLALQGVVNTLFGEAYLEMVNSLLTYVARIISVIILAIVFFTVFTSLVERMVSESTFRTFILFIITFIIVAMVIDVTPLSDPLKNSLYAGLSIGVGASLSIFAVWFFFQKYLEKLVERKSEK